MTLLRSALSGICLLGVLGSGIGLARAAPALTESAAAMKARQKARIAFGARKWTEAEASFEAVLAAPDAAGMTAVQRAEVLGYLGLCELEQGKHREAAEHPGQSLEQDAALNRALLDMFTRAFNRAAERVGRIYVAASPPDAEILMDGEPIGTGATAWVGSDVLSALFYGALKSAKVTQNRSAQDRFLRELVSFDFDDLAAEHCARIRSDLESDGQPIGSMDLLIASIASIALANGLILVTHNVREFSRVKGLPLEDLESS